MIYNYIMLAAAAMMIFGIYAMAKSRKRDKIIRKIWIFVFGINQPKSQIITPQTNFIAEVNYESNRYCETN